MFQRMTYSGQKKRNLVKPFLFCVTNGRILDLYVPFAAIDNDSTIIKDLLKKNHNKIKQTRRENDIFVLDRGFRDAVKDLEGLGYKVMMPAYLDSDKKQLTTEQANNSRLVTKSRWVIEAINGILKQSFKA